MSLVINIFQMKVSRNMNILHSRIGCEGKLIHWCITQNDILTHKQLETHRWVINSVVTVSAPVDSAD